MLKLGRLFQDRMMLQRGKPVRVWGEADPGAAVRVELEGALRAADADDADDTARNAETVASGTAPAGRDDLSGTIAAETVADADGKWMLTLPALLASDCAGMRVCAGEEVIAVRDIAIGEVFIAGGQSNMEFPMWYEKHFQQAFIDNCIDPGIRFFQMPQLAYPGQEAQFTDNLQNVWRKAEVNELGFFSAVGYWFQKEIRKALGVPVGIIACNWGGTTSVAWMKKESFEKDGGPWKKQIDDLLAAIPDLAAYWERQKTNPMNDRGRLNLDFFSQFMLSANRRMPDIAQLFQSLGVDPSAAAGQREMMPMQLPGSLYENMLLEVAPFSARGVLWYQGESDDGADTAPVYGRMMTHVIEDWREAFGDALPFFMVELPGYGTWFGQPAQCFDVIRGEQEKTAQTVPDTWLASISDAGEYVDIHPKDKQVVGRRLALLVRKYVFGEDILADAPEYETGERAEDGVDLIFRNAGDGLCVRPLTDAQKAMYEEETPGCRLAEIPALQVFVNGQQREYTCTVSDDRIAIRGLAPAKDDAVSIRFAKTQFFIVNVVNSAGIPARPFEAAL